MFPAGCCPPALCCLFLRNGERSMRLDEAFLKKIIPEAQVLSGDFGKTIAFSLDSRTIKTDELFVPIQGEKTEGHIFLDRALKNGRGALVARSKKEQWWEFAKTYPEKLIIEVNDPEAAFFQLVTAWRMQFTFPIVAITGSVGKTSTKLLTSHILTQSGQNCFVSYGNQNTKFGVALNMARLRPDHDSAVFEIGINKRGEMGRVVELLQPTTSVIINIGHSHMEGLGSLADIATEKRDIFKYFKEDSIGIINGDQAILSKVGYAHPVIRFGLKTTNQVQARKVKVFDSHISFILKLYGKGYEVTIPECRQEFIANILSAASVAHYLGVDHSVIVKEIQKPLQTERRFESCPLKDYPGVIIDDAYNASPESVKAALLALQRLKTPAKKIVVLGDMLELGTNSPFWHRQIGRFFRKIPSVKHLILVGDQVHWTQKTAPVGVEVERVASWEDAAQKLREQLDGESVVLVKGSNGTNLSKLVEQFTNKSNVTQI